MSRPMPPGLWTRRPRLRKRAARQSVALREYLSISRMPYGLSADGVAYSIGHHAGRLMALRIEAYDALHEVGDG